jgi:CheY-like chemotaxis protein
VCHVLIIEDELLIALDIEDILSREGVTSFDMASTEQEAITAAAAHRPDIITADILLKKGLGSSAVEAIEQLYGPVPTIFITATPDVCRPGDTARVLRKPVNEMAVCKAYHALRAAA